MAVRRKDRRNYGIGSVYVRKTSKGVLRYYIDFRDKSGNRIQQVVKHATNWKDSHQALRDAVFKEHNEQRIKKPKKIRFGKFVEMFINNYSRVNKRSWRDDFWRLRKWSEFLGNVNLDEVSPLDIERFKSSRLEEGVTPSTVNRHLAILKRLYNIAGQWGYSNQNPVKGIRFYSEKDRMRQRILGLKEEGRLLEAASEHLRPIILIALNTGMRRGEILALRWTDIDFEAGEITVKTSKNGKPRIVDINSRLFQVLHELKNQVQNDSYLFLNPRTGKPFKKLQRSFRSACRRSGIVGLRFHDLRHTAASRMVVRGVDLIRVKEILGHSSVRITERYTHSNREERKKAVELLCKEPSETSQKGSNLLHHRDMEQMKEKPVPLSALFSWN
jgi:integrase